MVSRYCGLVTDDTAKVRSWDFKKLYQAPRAVS